MWEICSSGSNWSKISLISGAVSISNCAKVSLISETSCDNVIDMFPYIVHEKIPNIQYFGVKVTLFGKLWVRLQL